MIGSLEFASLSSTATINELFNIDVPISDRALTESTIAHIFRGMNRGQDFQSIFHRSPPRLSRYCGIVEKLMRFNYARISAPVNFNSTIEEKNATLCISRINNPFNTERLKNTGRDGEGRERRSCSLSRRNFVKLARSNLLRVTHRTVGRI